MIDTQYMQLALELAKRGMGFVNPNPLVGAVIVKDGLVIGQGWHERFGAAHAETVALANCALSPVGATMYVNLEPCCHWGKTPPCSEQIIAAGISRVVIGAKDPNPLVAGGGAKVLRRHGITVEEGLLLGECEKLNEVFFHYIKTATPFVVMKYAMSLDGKTAAYTGKSRWITGEKARKRVHQDRHRYMAIMVGVGTVLADDPLLTSRTENGKNPLRIICDTNLRLPLNSQIVKTAGQVSTVIATACQDPAKQDPYKLKGCEFLELSLAKNHIDLKELLIQLGQREIDSVLLEGGPTLNWSALHSGIVNIVHAYIAPKLLGGHNAPTPVMGDGKEDPGQAFQLVNSRIINLDGDILIESEVLKNVHRNN
ncbi:MAG: bifunctional diaminohydroxyphosphoribosylaminopyrimidine deaminase/5-amino-6-(5-phosphoribosylamino)uracil reductase RibD [Clostridiales bacterium]|nr:bifunctional diaminohydroxyphosphoribosylaminopyrimidine deaminase/5-amino-6-(5-phosphoribosylamino)uracil reductase RibD [Clostridiales bacterium]